MEKQLSNIWFTVLVALFTYNAHAADKAKAPQDNSRYVIKGGEVYDTETDRTWQRCSVGMRWIEGKGCKGVHKQVDFEDAQKLTAGQWRIPAREEYVSLYGKKLEDRITDDALDERIFPDSKIDDKCHWASNKSGDDHAWSTCGVKYTFVELNVRLVRTGQ